MVSLIIGRKGTGKTKHLIEEVNAARDASIGNVICVEKGNKLRYDIKLTVRLVSAEEFSISGYDAYYGFLAGMCADDSDITDILCDGTLKIGGPIGPEFLEFFRKVSKLAEATDTKFVFTISADESELPAEIFDFCKKI
ncbi:MAG: hypothetical protein IKT04_03455 [Clostridia bacterium]|nr:hypothetical protein [Clostridia bacterium]MBR6479538.1 hypothetical protein [Clostridia bacterium]